MVDVYAPLKDLFLWLKNRETLQEIDPIILSRPNVTELINKGLLQGSNDDYSFSAVNKVDERTMGTNPEREIVWIIDKKAKTKRKVCIKAGSEIDLILLKKLR
jgi:hypothetical protein